MTASTAGPGRLAHRLVRLVVRTLPRGEPQQRYRQEFLAELHGMPPSHRARHVVGLLVGAPRLNVVVRRSRREAWEDVMGQTRKPLLCLLHVRHRWAAVPADDGTWYEGCLACGRNRPARTVDVRQNPRAVEEGLHFFGGWN